MAHCPAAALPLQKLRSAIVRDPLTVSPDTAVIAAITGMNDVGDRRDLPGAENGPLDELHRSVRASCVCVVVDKRIVGILTERDVVRLSGQRQPCDRWVMQQVMTPSVVTLRESALTDLALPLRLLQQHHIRHLPIVDDQDCLVGLLTHESLQHIAFLQPSSRVVTEQDEPTPLPQEENSRSENSTVYLQQQIDSRTAILEARVKREQLVLELTTQIRSSLSLQTILDTTVAQVRQVVNCDRVSIWQFTQHGYSTVVAESTDLASSITHQPVDTVWLQPDQAWPYHQGWISTVPDVAKSRLSASQRQLLEQLQIRAIIVVPLLCGNELWGLLNVTESQNTREWQPEEVELLQALSTQLAIALQQAKNHQCLQLELKERKRAEARLGIKNALLAKITNNDPLAEILQTVIEAIEQTLKDALCSICLLDQDNRFCSSVAPKLPSAYTNAFNGVMTGEGVGSCGTAVWRKEIVVTTDIATDPLWQAYKDVPLQYGLEACWSVPIIVDESRVVGTFAVYYRYSKSPQPQELDAIAQMAAIAGVAIKHHQVLEALQESEARWQFALEGAGAGVWDWHADDDSTFFSRQWKAMLGYEDHEISAHHEEWESRIHPDDRDGVYEAIDRHRRGESATYENEHRLRCKDGRYKWILTRGQALKRAANGDPVRIIGIHTDISDRKQAEAQLQNLIAGTAATTGQEFFPALVQHIATALDVAYAVVTEVSGDTLHTLSVWGQGALQPSFAYPLANTPCGQSLQDGSVYCESSVQQQFPDCIELVEMEIESYLGIALQDTQGQAIGNLCIFHKKPIRNPQQAEQILRVFAARAAAELERQRALTSLEQLNCELEAKVKIRTAELQQREARYRALVEVIPDLMIRLHADGTYLDLVVGEGVQLFNPEQARTGSNIYNALPIEHARQRMFYVQQALQTQVIQVHEHEIIVDGSLRLEESRIIALNEEEVLVIVRDVTARRQAEITMKRQLAAIEAAVDGIGVLQDNVYLSINQAHLTLFGYEQPEELIGHSWHQLYSPEEIERFEQEVFPQLVHDRAWQGEAIATRKDGSTFAQDLSLTLNEDNLLICVCRDISSRKRNELALQQLTQELSEWRDRYEIAAQASGQVLFEYDITTDRDTWGPNLEAVLGWTVADMPQSLQEHLERIHPTDRATFQAVIDNDLTSTE
ncbi:MAG: GAF domain-containing protein, partial [Cyanobacteria bacterium P01_F01_bin.86]